MKEKLTNNLAIKLIALFCAFFVWLAVVNVANPIKVSTREVPVTITNDQVLEQADLAYDVVGKKTVVISFKIRTKDDYAKIAGLMLNEMKEPLLEKQITLNVTEDACKLIAEKAYGKTYGAREIRRVIRQEVEDQIAECIIHNANTLRALTITAKDGKLVVQDEEVTA